MRQGVRRLIGRSAVGRAGAALCLAATLGAAGAEARAAADAITQPPNEDAYVYKAIPDVRIARAGANPVQLSALWSDRPLLLALVFSRCVGTCSPLLRSLAAAVGEAGGAGRDYRLVILSFDPADTAADMEAMRAAVGIAAGETWTFGVAPADDIRRLAAATGFWFRQDRSDGQYDHPTMVVAVDRGRVLRMLVGATVSGTQVSEIVQEFRGQFVPSYPRAGRIAFRCFEYDPTSGRYSLDWGLLLLVLPGACAALATIAIFSAARRDDAG